MNPITAEDITKALATRYAPPAFAFLPQVRNATGYASRVTRTADAVAMGLWPSRGLHLQGFEIKVSRSDWLSELRDPAKADEIHRYCHKWWIAVPDCGEHTIVARGELPDGWGLLTLKGSRWKCEVEAAVRDPEGLSYPFLAAVLRRALEIVTPEGVLKAEFERGTKKGFEEGKTAGELGAHRYREAIENFSKTSGINLLDPNFSWRTEEVGEIVKLLIDLGPLRIRRKLEDLRNVFESAAKNCADVLKEWENSER